MSVYHGPWVETRDDWFVEGAWAGPFEKGGIGSALFNAGTGGILRAGQAVFCTPTDMIGRLYSIRLDGRLFMANSLAFVLAIAGDEPDPCYPFYGRRLREYQDAGISVTHKTIPTRYGRQVHIHEYCQLAVDDELRLVRIEKLEFPRPASFDEYLSMLRGMLGAVLENAASPGRRHQRYKGLATVSGGYDSNALAALLSGLGVREAMTLCDKMPGDDSGEDVGQRLGMKVRVYGRTDFRTAPGVDEAEFFSWPDRVSGITFAPCEEQLVGKVLIMGQWGDKVFGLDHPGKYRDFRHSPYGCGRMIEFRLRVGFLDFNPLYAWGLHLSAMHAIATSPEMKPWRVGGTYDRPIARRILEEAGVPRGMFGSGKAVAPRYRFRSLADMSPAGRADFELYRRSMPRSSRLRHAWYWGLVRLRSACERLAKTISRRIWRKGGAVVESLIPVPQRYRDWDDLDFAMHWGHARVRGRYAEAVTGCGCPDSR